MSIDANPSVRINIRWSVQRDMEEMLEIEKESFGRFSWSRDDFMSVMRARNTIGLIAEIEEKVVGYIVYELSKTRLAILNLAVDKLYRHKSIGTQLINRIKEKLRPDARTRIVLHIREGNLNAQLFFKCQGFLATKVIKGFYDDTDEDAYRFSYRLGQQARLDTGRG